MSPLQTSSLWKKLAANSWCVKYDVFHPMFVTSNRWKFMTSNNGCNGFNETNALHINWRYAWCIFFLSPSVSIPLSFCCPLCLSSCFFFSVFPFFLAVSLSSSLFLCLSPFFFLAVYLPLSCGLSLSYFLSMSHSLLLSFLSLSLLLSCSLALFLCTE